MAWDRAATHNESQCASLSAGNATAFSGVSPMSPSRVVPETAEKPKSAPASPVCTGRAFLLGGAEDNPIYVVPKLATAKVGCTGPAPGSSQAAKAVAVPPRHEGTVQLRLPPYGCHQVDPSADSRPLHVEFLRSAHAHPWTLTRILLLCRCQGCEAPAGGAGNIQCSCQPEGSKA